MADSTTTHSNTHSNTHSTTRRSTHRTVAQKMGIKPGWRAHFVGAPDGVIATLGMPELDVVDVVEQPAEGERGTLDYVHLFVRTREEMRAEFPRLVPHVAPQGKLWVSWPKGGRLGTDLGLPAVIEIGYDFGMVESTCLRVDDTWTGLRFTHPKEGKVYQNSYGTLPSQR